MVITYRSVENYNYTNKKDFQLYIAGNRKPLIIKNVDIGECKEKWTTHYLIQALGKVDVRVHLSPVGQMNFLQKNFTYKSMSFEEFLQRSSRHFSYMNEKDELKPILCENEVLYLRAIGSDRRGKNVANFKHDFPQIAEDIKYPELFDENRFFSSVLRIASAGVQIWTHYDVMDNALIQISGEKRIVLFCPDDTPYMYLKGDKSEVIDIDHPDMNLYPEFIKAVQYECVLQPGDIIYIPAFWFHNVLCYTFSIGLNVFWKHLDNDMYDKRDVYGNKDIVPAAKALEQISKAASFLKTLPEDYKNFYLHRCIGELTKAVKEPQSDFKLVHNKEEVNTYKKQLDLAETETMVDSNDAVPTTSSRVMDSIYDS